MRGAAWVWGLLMVGSACADPATSDGGETGIVLDGPGTEQDDTHGEDAADETGGKLDVGGTATGGDGGDGGQCPCQDVLDGIYVLDNAGPLPSVWFFDPPANAFTEVGPLGCSAPPGWVANSMAIDRQGYAWLNYYEQATMSARIYRAPLSDLAQCELTEYSDQGGTWWLLGMGYAAIDATSSCDQLYIYRSDRYLEYPNFGPGGAQLGRFDEATDQVALIGPTDYPVGELTGTGDGRLFAFAPVSAALAVLVGLDKQSGAELEHVDLNGLDITNAFAFAFWGGDVYFFTETSPGSGVSQVTRLDYDGNEGGGLSVYNANTGLHIPGAGVSTCASFVPPG